MMWDEERGGIARPKNRRGPSRVQDRATEPRKYPSRLYNFSIYDGSFESDAPLLREALEAGLDPNAPLQPEDIAEWLAGWGCIIERPMIHQFAWPHWNTPLHRALFTKDYGSAALLLEHGADINIRNALGKTPLHEAVWSFGLEIALGKTMGGWIASPRDEPLGQSETVEFLLARGADLDATTIARTVQDHTGAQSKEIISQGGLTALALSITYGHVPLMRTLIEGGASVNIACAEGWYPFDLALLDQQWPALTVLLQHGAKPSGISNSDHPFDKELAQKLLFYSSTADVCPPSHLLSVYHHVLGQEKCQTALRTAKTNSGFTKDFVDVFFDALRNLAECPQLQSTSSFCNSCLEFQRVVEPPYAGLDRPAERELLTFPSITDLHLSAEKGCPMCGIIADAVDSSLDSHPHSENGGQSTKSAFWRENETTVDGDGDAPTVKVNLSICDGFARLFVNYKGYRLCYRNIEVAHLDGRKPPAIKPTDLLLTNWLPTEDLVAELCQPEKKAPTSPGSEVALGTAHYWLRSCESSPLHSCCQATSPPHEAPILPKRIIFIGDATLDPVLLDETAGMRANYCALSYCRGASAAFETTRDTLGAYKKSITLSNLPPTIRDAVLATRALGIHYLWVDILCIVQDDEEDWICEVAQMQYIFSRATLTLSSLVSSSTADGLFRERRVRHPKPVPLPAMRLTKLSRSGGWEDANEAKAPRMCVLVPRWLGDSAALTGPIHSCGWALQEQMLSARMLYFGDGLLHWECLSLYATEAAPTDRLGPRFKNPLYHNKDNKALETRKQRRAARGLGPGSDTAAFSRREKLRLWQDLVVEYSRRSFSRPSDRLPAFLGISNLWEQQLESKFTAGLLDGPFFAESLCWAYKKPNPTSTEAGSAIAGPTYSWASHPGALVTYELIQALDRETRPLVSDVSFSGVQVSRLQSRITGGITLRGKVGRFDQPLTDPCELGALLYDCEDQGIRDGDQELWYLELVELGKLPQHQGYGYPRFPQGLPASTLQLLMRKVAGQDGNVFRRVGMRGSGPEHYLGLFRLAKAPTTELGDMVITLV